MEEKLTKHQKMALTISFLGLIVSFVIGVIPYTCNPKTDINYKQKIALREIYKVNSQIDSLLILSTVGDLKKLQLLGVKKIIDNLDEDISYERLQRKIRRIKIELKTIMSNEEI